MSSHAILLEMLQLNPAGPSWAQLDGDPSSWRLHPMLSVQPNRHSMCSDAFFEEIPSHQSECGTGLDGVTASQAGSDAITDGIATAKEWMAEGDLDEGMTRTSEIPIKTGVKNMDAPATEGVEKRGNTSYGESCSAP
jgi:hypothetical protein